MGYFTSPGIDTNRSDRRLLVPPPKEVNGIVVASHKYLDITLQMIFLMMMISIDNVEHYLFKGILYCESLICVPWV